ncbi:hypothetical protein PG997_005083 [Apiospora hydei]|uniref:Uncharacterized protein n=1 Tax=Apiospora hydei TaxID=1337664 RepID=A0ABR1X434_9PEZI
MSGLLDPTTASFDIVSVILKQTMQKMNTTLSAVVDGVCIVAAGIATESGWFDEDGTGSAEACWRRCTCGKWIRRDNEWSGMLLACDIPEDAEVQPTATASVVNEVSNCQETLK